MSAAACVFESDQSCCCEFTGLVCKTSTGDELRVALVSTGEELRPFEGEHQVLQLLSLLLDGLLLVPTFILLRYSKQLVFKVIDLELDPHHLRLVTQSRVGCQPARTRENASQRTLGFYGVYAEQSSQQRARAERQ